LSQCNYFGPRNFGIFASYYTETLLYSNFRDPLFSRTCQAREMREIKGMRKKRVLQYYYYYMYNFFITQHSHRVPQTDCSQISGPFLFGFS